MLQKCAAFWAFHFNISKEFRRSIWASLNLENLGQQRSPRDHGRKVAVKIAVPVSKNLSEQQQQRASATFPSCSTEPSGYEADQFGEFQIKKVSLLTIVGMSIRFL